MFETILGMASLPILTITVSVVVSLIMFYAVGRRALAVANARIVVLEKQSALLHSQVIPISAAFQAILIQELTHFHTPEMDELMRKLGPPITITEDEMARLVTLLEERERDLGEDVPQEERDAAHMLPMVMKRVHTDKTRRGLEAEPLVRALVTQVEAKRDNRNPK
jgi:hypothetical protein